MCREMEKVRIRQRTLAMAMYIIENHATTRQTAKVFGIDHSCVSRDMRYRLKEIDLGLHSKVRKVFDENVEYNRENIAVAREAWRMKNASNNSRRSKNGR